ncbi:Acetyltransferase (GNAT) family protein [Roseivivax sediminis]|uniref:Acetyltransferase (GNAT) family protein n=2 Tax=Roseivivax sediminis TaxID=936889 RepID=A0A1I2EBD2_9RHOB|nr:Acetyltransferase (GNAT) family protein [Roseivivax sediminis]
MTSDEARSILNNGNTRGVFDASSMIGYCGLQMETLKQTRHRAEIGPFYVTSTYQGRGAARVLMDGVIGEARTRGIEQLELFVEVGNTRALAFYERFGFERISVHPDGFRIGGKPRDAYFCILRI